MSAETYEAMEKAIAEHFAECMNSDPDIEGVGAIMTGFVGIAVGVNSSDRYALHMRFHSDQAHWQLLGLATLLQAQMQNNALWPDQDDSHDGV